MGGIAANRRDAEVAWRLLDVAEELGRMGTWDLDLASGGMVWSDGLARILDIAPDELERQPPAVLAFIHPQDRDALGAIIETLLEDPDRYPGGVVTHDYRVVRSDGGVAEVRARARLVRDDAGVAVRWVGSIQDVTGERRGERVLLARTEVTRALREWASFDEGIVDLLRRTAQALRFTAASLWVWDEERGALACRASWHAPEAGDLDAEERDRTMGPGEGLVGAVWKTRAPALDRETRASLGVPVLVEQDILGVVLLAGLEQRIPDESLVEAFSATGREIGAFLDRRRAKLGPAPLTARELEVLKLAADGLSGPAIARRFVVSPSTVKTHFENIYEKLGVSDRASAVALALRTGLLT